MSSDVAHVIVMMSYMDMSSDVAHAIVVTLYMDAPSVVAHVLHDITTIVCATSYDVFIYNVTTIYIMKPF
jgi:hypothetical protein